MNVFRYSHDVDWITLVNFVGFGAAIWTLYGFTVAVAIITGFVVVFRCVGKVKGLL